MGAIADAFNTWLRDDVVEGAPGSGVNEPSKSEGRSIGSLLEQAIAAAVSDGVSAGGAAKLVLDVSRNETTVLTTGAGKFSFRLPYGLLLSEVRASLSTPFAVGATTLDLKLAGVSILSAAIQVDATMGTSVGSAAPPAILTHELPDNGVVTVDVATVGSSADGKGLKVYLIGSWAPFGVGAIPYYATAGGVAGSYNSQSIAVPYAAGLQADDVAILHLRTQGLFASTTPTVARPSGWTTIANPVGPAGGGEKDVGAWFWKRLLGTETGTVACTASGGDGSAQGMMGQMFIFRGCVANGDPYESAISASGTSTTMDGTTLVTLGPNRLAGNFYSLSDNLASDPDTGWVEAFDEAILSALVTQRYAASVRQMPVAGSTPAEIRTVANSRAWSTLSLAFVPASS
jgi:hypothetical protein